MKITTFCPLRISFSGGGTDVESFFKVSGGITISHSIKKFVKITTIPSNHKKLTININKSCVILDLETKNLKGILQSSENLFIKVINYLIINNLNNIDFKGLAISIESPVERNSGLGVSSATVCGLIENLSELMDFKYSKEVLIKKALYLERNLFKFPGGLQDYYPVVHGGLNIVKYSKSKIQHTKKNLPKKLFTELNSSSFIIFTNSKSSYQSFSKTIIKSTGGSTILRVQKNLADTLHHDIDTINIRELGNSISDSGLLKTLLNPDRINIGIQNLCLELIEIGAFGAKLCGSGGGGYVYAIIPETKLGTIRKFLKQRNLKLERIRFENRGIKTVST